MAVVSVVIPFYNGVEYLKETIGSIINQSYHDWECLIVDDHSPVSGEAIINAFKDPRIKYVISHNERGMANARNWGCQLAVGKYIALNDQDDLSLPDRLSRQVEFLETNPDFFLCGSWRKNFGGDNSEYKHESDADLIQIRMIGNSQFSNPSVMFRKSLVEEHGLLFRQEFAPSDDYDFLSRAVLRGKATNIPQFLLHYRVHPNQESVKKSATLENKALQIRVNYINELLHSWIELGFKVEEMAFFMSPVEIKNFEAKKSIILINNWIKINDVKPVFDQSKWENFLYEKIIVALPVLKGGRLIKFKVFISLCKKYMAFGKKYGYWRAIKQVIKLMI